MKANHFVTLFCLMGLLIGFTGSYEPAMARDEVKGNLKRMIQGDAYVSSNGAETNTPVEMAAPPAAPTSGGTRFIGTCYSSLLLIPAAGFSSDGYLPDSLFFSFYGGYLSGTSQNYGCVKAPAYLPNGATVTEIWVNVYDNDSSYEAYMELHRVDNFSGTETEMAYVETSGSSSSIQVIKDDTVAVPLVQYPDYSYYVSTCLLSEDIRLYSVRIYYDPPNGP